MKRGPISFARKLTEKSSADKTVSESFKIDVPSLWKVPDVLSYLRVGRTAFDEFCKGHPDFPRIKLGGQWRFDPDSVRAYVLRLKEERK